MLESITGALTSARGREDRLEILFALDIFNNYAIQILTSRVNILRLYQIILYKSLRNMHQNFKSFDNFPTKFAAFVKETEANYKRRK